jgi:antirestriction protein ArdC
MSQSSLRLSAADAAAVAIAEITKLLERGVLPWRKPWDAERAFSATPGLPLRANGVAYRGANIFLLWAAQMAHGFQARTWMTYRQAAAFGAHIRKGERATPVLYYGQTQPRAGADAIVGGDASEAEGVHRYRFLKLYHVFNLDQIDGLPASAISQPLTPHLAPTSAMQWAKELGAKVLTGGDSAFYAPGRDVICLPPLEAFRDEAAHSACIYHELIHWTGASHRLDLLGDYFTDRAARAREELRAECGAAILGAMIGLAPDHYEDHASYIGDWLTLLRDEPRAFLSAAAKAQAAVDWLIGRARLPSLCLDEA